MLISELIAKLEKAQAECGDVELWSHSQGSKLFEYVTGLSIAGDDVAAVVMST